MNTIYLIGFMGSGKSTIGKELAEVLSKKYIDSDDYIENKHQEKIPNIFKTKGEEVFRDYETVALKEVSAYDVVSTGGGIVEKEKNLKTMKNTGVVIFLKTSFEEVSSRLKDDINRPLWDNDIEGKIKLFNRRIPLYESYADYIINTDNKSIKEIVREISGVIEEI